MSGMTFKMDHFRSKTRSKGQILKINQSINQSINKYKNQSTEGTIMVVVRLMLSFWRELQNSLEPTLNGSEEFETYSKAILYRRIVFIIVDLLFCVIIIVLLVIAFQIYIFKRQGPNGIVYPYSIPYFPMKTLPRHLKP